MIKNIKIRFLIFLMVLICIPMSTGADEHRITVSEGESADIGDGNTLKIVMADPDTQQVLLSIERNRENIYMCCLNKGELFEYYINTYGIETSDGQYAYMGYKIFAEVEHIKSEEGVTRVTFDPFHVTDFELPEQPEVESYRFIAEGEALVFEDDYYMFIFIDSPEKVNIILQKGIDEPIYNNTLSKGEYFNYSTENYEVSFKVDHINLVKDHKSVSFSPANFERYKPITTPTYITPSSSTATTAPLQTSTPVEAQTPTQTSTHQSGQTLKDSNITNDIEESVDLTPDENVDNLPGFGILIGFLVLLIVVQIFQKKR